MSNAVFDGVVRLADWGVIRASGADAAAFLQSQLTQDVLALDADRAAPAGWCSAKGRLLASFVVWAPARDEICLACSADLLAPVAKRLAMFVLRAKCRLSDASAELPLWGAAGGAVPSGLMPWQCLPIEGGLAIGLPPSNEDAGPVVRALRVQRPPSAPALDPAAWAWLEVGSAQPRISSATMEQFVPQMVNLELVGGVNFKKGCYPGQEVVARSQYRGTLKRRAFVFEAQAAGAPAQELFHSADPGQPAGMVVNAATLGARHRVLAEVKLAALDGGTLHLGSAQGPALARVSMPYEVPLDAALA